MTGELASSRSSKSNRSCLGVMERDHGFPGGFEEDIATRYLECR